MQQRICILQTSGLYVDDGLCDQLYLLTLAMAKCASRREDFILKEDGTVQGTGSLSTSYSIASIGQFSGIEFKGKIDVGNRSFEICFLIGEQFLGRKKPVAVEWADLQGPPGTEDNLNMN